MPSENRVDWELSWKDLSRRIGVWSSIAEAFLQQAEHLRADAFREPANRALASQASELIDAVMSLDLPPTLRSTVETVAQTLGPVFKVTSGTQLVMCRWVTLTALRGALDEAANRSELPVPRLIARAFLHLNRTLCVDDGVRSRWREAFAYETRCEQLGALHLLAHGVFAFKADAGSGRTDLILGEPLSYSDEVKAADATVLTEWKLVRPGDSSADKAREGRAQAARYARVELGGFELRAHRYIVLVSLLPIAVPVGHVSEGITYNYVNIVIDLQSPSVEARRIIRQA